LESMEASMKNLISQKDKLIDKNEFLEHKVKIDALNMTTSALNMTQDVANTLGGLKKGGQNANDSLNRSI
jgi:hypothetical protein